MISVDMKKSPHFRPSLPPSTSSFVRDKCSSRPAGHHRQRAPNQPGSSYFSSTVHGSSRRSTVVVEMFWRRESRVAHCEGHPLEAVAGYLLLRGQGSRPSGHASTARVAWLI